MRLVRVFPFLIALILFSTLASANVSAQNATIGVANVEFVGWVTGPRSLNQTDTRYRVDGTDLGSMFALGDTVYIAFGDTYACCRPPGGGAGGLDWRSNVMAYSTDHDLSDGITFDGMITDAKGHALQLLTPSPDDATLIPTNGIAVGKRLYLHYMAVSEWGDPGHWTLNRSGWAYSDDKGQSWTQPTDAIWSGDTNFGQAALVADGGNIYVFGIHGGRYGGAALARVPAADVLDMTKYSYWSGTDWGSDLPNAAVIIPAPVGELSVAWNNYLGRWIMLYTDEPLHGVVMRTSPSLTGTWSDPIIVVSSDDYPNLYGSFLHPWASDGQTIYFNMSQAGFYNVRLMRAQLTKSG